MSLYNKYYFGVLIGKSALLRFRSSQESNINREVPPSFVLTSLKLVCKRKKKKCARKKREAIVLGFYIVLVEFYTEEVLLGFLPHKGFPR